jgi:nucleotide-binding universal stress UspA family protein
MFQRIVVPLDGSRFAESALIPSRELARAFSSKILLVRAQSPSGLPIVVTPSDRQESLEKLNQADEYMHSVVENLKNAGFDADMVISVSEPGAGIAEAAELSHADVIIMATHLRWKVAPKTGPSTTLNVLARSHVPILAWRASPEDEQIRPRLPRTNVLNAGAEAPIIVPLDGSRFGESALPYAEALSRAFGSYIVLVQAIETNHIHTNAPATDKEALEYLEQIRKEILLRKGHAITVVRTGTPLSVIERAWREFNGSLIVMASHGHTGILRTFLGSVAARIIEEVEAPILVTRPETSRADFIPERAVRQGQNV